MLHKEFYGKGPTKARTYLQDDVVLVLLRGGYTRVEETLMRDGRMDAVTASAKPSSRSCTTASSR